MTEYLQNPEDAETLALQALAFLFATPSLAERFMSETGFRASDVRANAQSPEVLEAALTTLVNDEALLLTFAANAGIRPEGVVAAYEALTTAGGRKRPSSTI